jgi:CheY-like chemotaxis protein
MKSVFLIDDDPVFVFLAERIFRNILPNLDIQTFPDGDLAVRALEKITLGGNALPDLIFLDINMPVMDGWQFLQYYDSRQDTIDTYIPIYVVSSTISVADIETCRQYTCVTDVLIKPINERQLKKIFLRS